MRLFAVWGAVSCDMSPKNKEPARDIYITKESKRL
jgi:hypothetical protein